MKPIALSQALDFLDPWLQSRLRQTDIPGISIAIASSEEPIWKRAYGKADMALDVPMSTSHLFDIASQSKFITMTCILHLADQKLLKLDDPIGQYLPWIRAHENKELGDVTIRHLLSHSAGIVRDSEHAMYWQDDSPFPKKAALRSLIMKSRLAIHPNMRAKYSNLGYSLLGEVIEVVTRHTFRNYVRVPIGKICGTSEIYGDRNALFGGMLATGYRATFDKIREPDYSLLTPRNALAAAVGCVASPEAMCKIAQAHFFDNPALFSDMLKREAQRTHWTITKGYSQGYRYGLGLEIVDIAGRQLQGHTGSSKSHKTATFFDPDLKIAVSVSVNCKDAPIFSIVRGIFGALLHFHKTATKPTPPHLAHLNGQFYSSHASMQVIATDTAVVTVDLNEWDPFTSSESLAVENSRTLRVKTPGNVHTEDEQLFYVEDKGTTPYITYCSQRFDKKSPNERTTYDPMHSQAPFTVPAEEGAILFRHYFGTTSQDFFHLEVLPEYIQQEDAGSESLQAWLRGNIRHAVHLLEKQKLDSPLIQLGVSKLSNANSAMRVRLIDDEITPYMHWEAESYKRINIPLYCETICYLPKSSIKEFPIPTGDILIYDNERIIVSEYNGSKPMSKAFYNVPTHSEARQMLRLKKSILTLVGIHGMSLTISQKNGQGTQEAGLPKDYLNLTKHRYQEKRRYRD